MATDSIQSTPADDAARSKSTLFVSGLPYSATSQDLESFASEIGLPLRSCWVVADRLNPDHNNKGVGYIVFALFDNAQKALPLLKKKKFLGARTLKIEWATKKKVVNERKAAGLPVADKPEKKKKAVKQVPHKGTIKSEDSIDAEVTSHVSQRSTNKRRDHSIIITGLGDSITLKDIRIKARKYGTLSNITYPWLSEWNSDARIAKVEYSSPEDVENAVKSLNNHTFKGATITAFKFPTQSSHKQSKLIIRNLPFSCTVADLVTTFKPYGIITECTLPAKPDGKTLLGFGFVQFLSIGESEKAVDGVNGTEIKGRKLAVDFTLPKNQYLQQAAKEEDDYKGSGVEFKDEDGHGDSSIELKEEDEAEPPAVVEYMEESSDDRSSNTTDDDYVYSEDRDGSVADDEWIDEEGDSVDNSEREKPRFKKDDASEGCTLFVRNLPFEATEDDLFQMFSTFGTVKYAKIAVDSITGHSRGTAFVCFYKQQDTRSCLEAYERASKAASIDTTTDPSSSKNNKVSKVSQVGKRIVSSIIAAEPSLTAGPSPFVLGGRFLILTLALPKAEADKVVSENKSVRREKDKRNLYLMREGVIFPSSEAAKHLTPPELEARTQAYGARKKLLASNPNLFISKTRLSVRNLGLKVDDAELRQVGKQAVKAFWKDVEAKIRQPLEPDVIESDIRIFPNRPTPGTPTRIIKVKQAKIQVAKDRVNAETGKPRSKGYGFIEYDSHADALAALRWMNNNKDAFKSQRGAKAPIVEFSIENAQVVRRRDERAKRSREKSLMMKREKGCGQGAKAADGDKKTTGRKEKKGKIQNEDSANGGVVEAAAGKRKEKKAKTKKRDRANDSVVEAAGGKHKEKKAKIKNGDSANDSVVEAAGGKRKEKKAKTKKRDSANDSVVEAAGGKHKEKKAKIKNGDSANDGVVEAAGEAPLKQTQARQAASSKQEQQQRNTKKRRKEQVDDEDEAKFEKLVHSYKKNLFGGAATCSGDGHNEEGSGSSIRRWFA
ncbi:hypothetical protein SeMB42_g04076 [Synchytrium endobioticum]|uniref:RRM domain-containing protein n=1 Tax=Synchytrium endobioticum TaxID=286115 RepID=A0A507D1X9_9FUNG|nr:hypothetical protein SeMB42_g04076 [Synchytrium endobioticum]